MIGQAAGPFRILAELGRGGMGTVWLAETAETWGDLAPGTRVALKIFHPHLRGNAEVQARFEQEARLGARLRSDFVVRTHGGGTVEIAGHGPSAFLAMEPVEGQTLRDLLREIGPFPEPLALLLARQAAAALAAVHEAGVVHRDVKPENLLVTADHRVKLMDLGVARLQEASLRLSRTGEFLGSLPYAAPEQLTEGTPVDGRADLYALGVVLYEAVTGRNPFHAADAYACIRRHCELVPDKPGLLNPQISHMLEELIMTLLEKRREDRFPDAAALAEALDVGANSRWWQARQTVSMRPGDARLVRRVRLPRETAVVGRDREIEILEAAWRDAAEGRGRVVLLVGEAGIGKSRLADELAARLEARGAAFQFLHGGTPPEGAVRPLQPFSEALLDRLGEEALEDRLLPLLRATPALVPAFAAYLRGAPAPSGAEPLTRDSVLAAAAECLRSLAEGIPAILLVEDLHFADEETRRFFAYLARQAADLRLLLVATARPEEGIRDLLATVEHLPGAVRIDLPRLGPREAVALLRECFGSQALVDQIGLRILEKADGNPFFLFEIVRGLREKGAIAAGPDGTFAAKLPVTEVELPGSLRDLLLLRLSELDEEDMDVLHAAAVQGFEFEPEVAAEALGMDRIPLLKRLGRLERRHRLVRHVGYRYRFDHHLVREVLYGELAPALREEYHRLVAEALRSRAAPPEVVASHFFRSSRPEAGLADFLPGLGRLKDGFQNDAGAAFAELGLKALPKRADVEVEAMRFEALLHLAAFLDRLGERERQEQALREARESADRMGGPEPAMRTFEGFSWMFANTGRFEEARQAAEQALHLAAEAKDRRGEARASKSLGTVAWSLGRLEAARALYERALGLAREIDDPREEADALGNLGTVAQNTGDAEGARRFHGEALALRRRCGDRAGEAQSLSNLGIVAYLQGRYGEAREFHEQALRLRREVGDRHGEANSLNNLGAVAHYLGEYAEARDFHGRSLAIKRRTGDRAGEATSLNNLGNIAYAVGDLEEAGRMHAHAAGIRREIGDIRGQAYSVSNLGLVAEEGGRLGEARRLHEEALALNRRIGDRAGIAVAQTFLGTLAAWRGAFDEAAERLGESLGVHRGLGDARGESYAIFALSELARQRGDWEGARAHAERALSLRRAIGYAYGVMGSCLQAGEAAAATGRADEARALLLEARDAARKLGRPGAVALAEARLALLDEGSPPPAPASGLSRPEEVDFAWALLRLAERGGDADAAVRHRARLRELLHGLAASMTEEDRQAFWSRTVPARLVGPG